MLQSRREYNMKQGLASQVRGLQFCIAQIQAERNERRKMRKKEEEEKKADPGPSLCNLTRESNQKQRKGSSSRRKIWNEFADKEDRRRGKKGERAKLPFAKGKRTE